MKLTIFQAYALLLTAGCLGLPSVTHASFSLEGTLWSEVSHKVEPSLLYAVALAESKKYAKGGFVRPWPWAVNVAGKGYYFDNRPQAEAFVDTQLAKGVRNMDIGPMQINVRWHGHRVKNPKDLFDLTTAIKVGADILAEAIASAPHDKTLAVGRYHTWSDESRAREYGAQVLRYQKAIIKEGAQ